MIFLPKHLFSNTLAARFDQLSTISRRGILSLLVLSLTTTAVSAAQLSFDNQPIGDAVGTITFNEVDLGTVNPTFTFADIPEFGDLTVSFGSIFVGQVLGPIDNSLLETQPDAPLMLDGQGPDVATLLDLRSSTPPVLGGANGDRFFSTPLAIHFDQPVNAVSFKIGSFDGPDTTFVEVFDQQGISLGLTQNTSSGFETIAARSSEVNISGVSVYVTEEIEDWEGFGLDDVAVAVIPEPAANVMCLLLVALATMMRRRFH